MRLSRTLAVLASTVVVALLAPSQSAADIQTEVLESAVTITTELGTGSGFFISSNEVMTAYHVLEGADQITVTDWNGEARGTAVVMASSRLCDVAVVRVDGLTAPALTIRDTPTRLSEPVYAIGSPIGRPVLSAGVVTGVGKNRIRTSVPVEFGNSGGPLLDEAGAVVGVVVQKDYANEALAVPIARAEGCLTMTSEATPDPAPTSVATWPAWLVPVAVVSLLLALMSLVIAIIALVVASRRRRPIRITLDSSQN